jgi:predicted RNase H-like HicB family nuclease
MEQQILEYFLSLKYPISIYPEEEDGYTALIPDLPGCMGQGETLEEVIINIEEARKLWIETVYFSGKKEIPLPSKR